ncbi:hypothetical protein LP123_02010 [Moraxella bovis]|uniref:Lipoprotein n=1 Tax=Moraxella bovis TaxID=476 RepID=A0AAX3ETT3_MORBO|nr:hypothetical protein [Moraxella bovis]AWY21218.1 hypothetical protein DQF64_12430 [Moraxella bovis]OOR85927.1 hypothetical protein B0182_13865 [Moraxella bovis]UYZ81550.1 hypothetical protein LP113_02025 [Moraxella bovis]UYZ89162.1 hypothetical protein LP114_12230 [Moraxella bovis]UYZ95738.1 hypothetical protein LP121_04040 [Moraxella bovis]
MKYFIFLCIFLVACEPQKISVQLQSIRLENDNIDLMGVADIKSLNGFDYEDISQNPAKRMICTNDHDDRIQDHDVLIHNHQVKFKLNVCQNKDNRLCVEKPIQSPIKMQCYLLVSGILGWGIASEEFDIIYD